MSFFQRLKANASDEWRAYTQHPFTTGLADGTLPECGFRRLRPGIPIERGHAFRSKAATFSDEGDRAPLPAG
jgi:hypothetical protein